jgi:hypothetical protein
MGRLQQSRIVHFDVPKPSLADAFSAGTKYLLGPGTGKGIYFFHFFRITAENFLSINNLGRLPFNKTPMSLPLIFLVTPVTRLLHLTFHFA